MTIKSTRAPRKTKVVSVTGTQTDAAGNTKTVHLDTPEQIAAFLRTEPSAPIRRLYARPIAAGTTGFAAALTAEYAVASLLGLVMETAVFASLPWLLQLLALVLSAISVIFAGLWTYYNIHDLVSSKKVDAMYLIARDKVLNVFNFRKEVTS